MKQISNIPENNFRGWKVNIDGKEAFPSLVSISSGMGVLEYGLVDGKYDSWLFHENAGGGAITVPYFLDEGTLFVGLVMEKRVNIDGGTELPFAMGGFVDPEESHETAQKREAMEEAGIDTEKAEQIGVPFVSNRTFFVAETASEGIKVFALKVKNGNLFQEDGKTYMKAKKKGAETRLVFIDAKKAIMESRDAITIAAIARLQSSL